MTYQSKFQIVNFVLPNGSQVGIKESYEWVNKVEVDNDWNGNPIIFPSRFSRRMIVRHQADGDAVRFEPLFESLALGSTYTLYLIGHRGGQIPTGQSVYKFENTPVPNSIIVTDLVTKQTVPYTYVAINNTLTLNTAAVNPTAVQYRPSGTFILTKYSGGANEIAGNQNWACEWVEIK